MKKEQQNRKDRNQGSSEGKKSKANKEGIYTEKCMTVEIKRERKASKSKKNTQEK